MKPKIIQNSKDMLSRSFNPAKCKTSLKLASSRLKLLRNKKEMQVKQIKREIALLLESSQDQIARIRVEHVIREEKMVAAYDLLSIYCELIVARLPIMESQKGCPIDLKEAIASVLFASTRCGDVPELMDVKKHIMAKYGKDFTVAAIELRPQCGVGRLLVEKLSAVGPDLQTKNKILTTIAQEHNVVWTSMSFDEKDLGLRQTSGMDGIPDAESSPLETKEVKANVGSANMHISLSNSSEYAPGSFMGGKKPDSASTSCVNMTTQSRARSSDEDRSQQFQGGSSYNFLERQKLNIESKDAAFESAERGSVDARTVAELSSSDGILGSYLTKSRKSSLHTQENEYPRAHFQFMNEYRSSSGNVGPSNEKIDLFGPSDSKREDFFEAVASGDPDSWHSSSKDGVSNFNGFLDQEVPLEHGFPLEFLGEVPVDVDSSQKHSVGTIIRRPDKHDEFCVEGIEKLHSASSSDSQSNDENIFAVSGDLKDESDADIDAFIYIGDVGGIHVEASERSSYELDGICFGKVNLDRDDSLGVDPIYDTGGAEFHTRSSVGDNLLQDLPLKADPSSPKCISRDLAGCSSMPFYSRKNSSQELSETLMPVSELDMLGPVTFDDSDGYASECDEKETTRHPKVVDHSELYEHDEVEISGLDEMLMQPTHGEWKSEDIYFNRNIKRPESVEKLSPKDLNLEHPSFCTEDANMNFNDFEDESMEDEGRRLNLGKLTGGFRNKHQNLASLKNQLVSLEKRDASAADKPHSVVHPRMNMVDNKRNTEMPFPDAGFENTSCEEEYWHNTIKKEGHSATTAKEPNDTRSSFGVSNSSNNSDGSNPYEDPSRVLSGGHLDEDPPRRCEVNTGSSLRAPDPSGCSDGSNIYVDPPKRLPIHVLDAASKGTKASTLASGTNLYNKSHLLSESEPQDPDHLHEGNTADIYKPWADTVFPNVAGSLPIPKLEVHDTDAFLRAEPRILNSGTASHRRQYGMFSQKPSAVGKPSNPEQIALASVVSETPKKPMHEQFGVKHNTIKRTTHVHPKLPDYDVLVQSLRRSQS